MDVNESKRRFSAMLFWLAKRMAAPGGVPKMIDRDLQADYWEALSDVAVQRLEWGAKHVFATQRFFPMPTELRQAALLAPSSVLPPVAPVVALPYTPPDLAAAKMSALLDALESGDFSGLPT